MLSGLVCRNGRPRASRHRAAAAAITPRVIDHTPSDTTPSNNAPSSLNRRADGASAERERVVAAAAAAKRAQRARRAPTGAHITASELGAHITASAKRSTHHCFRARSTHHCFRASLPQRPAPSQPSPRRCSRDHTPLRRTTRRHHSIVELTARAPSTSESSQQPQPPSVRNVHAERGPSGAHINALRASLPQRRERVVAAAAAAKRAQSARRAPTGAHITASELGAHITASAKRSTHHCFRARSTHHCFRASLPQRPAPSQPSPRRCSRDHTPLRRTTRRHHSIVELTARAPSTSESSQQPQPPSVHNVHAERGPSGAHTNALRASLPQRPAPSQPSPRRRSRDHTPSDRSHPE